MEILNTLTSIEKERILQRIFSIYARYAGVTTSMEPDHGVFMENEKHFNVCLLADRWVT